MLAHKEEKSVRFSIYNAVKERLNQVNPYVVARSEYLADKIILEAKESTRVRR